MFYYKSLQWLSNADSKLLKNIKKNPKLSLNHSYINSKLNLEDELSLSNFLFENKKKIKKNNLKKINLYIISGSNISFIKKSIFLNCLRNYNFVDIEVFETYNLYESFLNYKKKKIDSSEKNIVFISLDTLHLIEFKKKQPIKDYINTINMILHRLLEDNVTIIIQNLINYQSLNYINKVNNYLLKLSKKYKFTIFDINKYTNPISKKDWFDNVKYNFAKIPFSTEYFSFYSYKLSRLISVIFGGSKKVLVLDLDNTLWGGIIGDDGIKKIKIGNSDRISKDYYNFQKFLKNLKLKGVLLAVCSKNSEDISSNVFKKKKMPLRLNDFVIFKSNWQNKVSNIAQISKELNLSLDSFVFFDDNPMERDIVRKNIPDVSVPEVDKNPSNYIRDITAPGYFDVLSFSKEDAGRTETYKSNIKRSKLLETSINMDEYLKSLNMRSKMSRFKTKNIDRIVQLFLRSNQFNLTTNRYQKKDILNFLKDPKIYTLQADLTDRFGENGIVALIVGKILNKTLIIENWVMSCRVLSRSLEQAILNKIIFDIKKTKINKIIGIYKPSAKNKLVLNHYKNLDFKLGEKNKYKTLWYKELKINNLKQKQNHIKIIHE